MRGKNGFDWAYVTGSVNQELLLENEYLAAKNRILRVSSWVALRPICSIHAFVRMSGDASHGYAAAFQMRKNRT
jgi:hypothetical protein